MENRFNLIDEPWIPIVDVGRVSLKSIFQPTEGQPEGYQPKYRALGGNPVEKFALMKLLLAIAQAAATPADLAEWQQMGWQGLSQRCLAYLERWHHGFFLYGDKPFLQMPAIAAAAIEPFGAVMPDISTGNTTVLTQSQQQRPVNDAEKVLLLITLMSCALGGKKTDNSVVLSPGYRGKTNDKGKGSTGKPGPSVAFLGLLHSFCLANTLQETLWLNLFTEQEIAATQLFQDVGKAPWEAMPQGESCPIAQGLTHSLIGRLIPLSRFCLLTENGLHYSEGIAHASHKEGKYDPSITVNKTAKELKVIWVRPEKRPWRELTAFLSFIADAHTPFDCLQLRYGIEKAKILRLPFAIWSGGLSVRSSPRQWGCFYPTAIIPKSRYVFPTPVGVFFLQF